MHFKIDWASLLVGRKFTVFACFTLYLRAIFQVQGPEAYICRSDLREGFLRYRFGGLIFEGAYTWRGLFSEFYGTFSCAALNLLGAIGPPINTQHYKE